MVGVRPSALQTVACSIVWLLAISACPLSGAVKLQVRDGRPFVDGVYVNGHGPYRFLLDTGTNINLIETGLARKIGMESTFEHEVESSTGKSLLPGSDGNVVELGPVRAAGQRFQFSKLETLHLAWPDVHGVLGQCFLSGFDYMLDLRGKLLEFGKQDPGGSRSQFRLQDGRSAVSTSLGDLVLDSGAPRLILFGVVPDPGERSDMWTLAGSKSVGMVSSKLAIEGRNVWRGSAVAIPAQAEAGVAGLMPLSLFKTVYVCNSEGYVVFEMPAK
jgi:hypothetical protein